MIRDNILLRDLFKLYKQKKYNDIYKNIHYIKNFKQCPNRYTSNGSTLDCYLYTYTQKHILQIIQQFYAAIRIYRFIIKKKYPLSKEKKIINDTNLYGEPINECKEHMIYLNADTVTYNSDQYYAFPYSELNKIMTHALLFCAEDQHIITSLYPKHPFTNKKFTLVELEYIMYQFTHHSLNYHKIIRMFQDSHFSLSVLNNIYGGEYLFMLSSELYIQKLTPKLFKKLFQTFWRFISFEYIHSRTNVKNRIINKVCKHCILSIPNFQTFLQPLLTKYYTYIENNQFIANPVYAKNVIIFKKQFLDMLSTHYPHVFKNKSYYHLHYNKYQVMKIKSEYKKKPTFYGIINLPIVSFTNDCKIIYDYNGQHCMRAKQVIITI